MTTSVLVTWSTRYGSTEEVAQVIASVLREAGLAVEARPVGTVESLERFEAVVLGSALYMGRLHRDARRFLSSQRDALTGRSVALFVLGPIHKDEKEWTGARSQLDREMRKLPWLKPFAQQMFGGRWDPARLGFPFSLFPPLRRMPVSDARDWDAIRAWAVRLAGALQPAARTA